MTTPSPTVVYTPGRAKATPVHEYTAELWRRRPFVWHLARSRLKAEHYDTWLGRLWIVLNPLLLAAVYLLLRTVVRPIGGADSRNLLLSHLIWGLFFYFFFSNIINGGANSLVRGSRLMLNTKFPRAVLPLSEVVRGLIEFPVSLAVYFVIHVSLGQPVGPELVFVLPMIVLLTVLATGVALLLATISVYFRDMSSLMPYIIRLWLYTTPILYRIPEIPEHVRPYLRWNPLYPFYGALSEVFEGGTPSGDYVLASAAWAIGVMIIGTTVFLRRESQFTKEF